MNLLEAFVTLVGSISLLNVNVTTAFRTIFVAPSVGLVSVAEGGPTVPPPGEPGSLEGVVKSL